MKSIILSNPKYKGQIELVYKPGGELGKMDLMLAELSFEQLNNFVTDLLPYHENDVRKLPKGFTVVESEFVIDFDRDFWKPYRKKVNQPRCLPLWAKLKKMEQLAACIGLAEYFACCDRGRKVADPVTYLRNKYWQTDWKTI